MDSEDDFYYSSDSEDAAVPVAAAVAEEEETYSNTKNDYVILKQHTIKQIQQNEIAEVSNVLSVSRGIACTLLLRENWNLNSVVDKWLAADDGVRDIITAAEKLEWIEHDIYCKICFKTVEMAATLSLPCGHPFCANCWKSYLSVFINDGSNCLKLRCPEPKCNVIAGLDMVELVSSDDDKKKYYHYLYRSYIECSKNRKWCPFPGCEYAVEFVVGGCESYDVRCDCSHKFCWRCTEECHRPVDCETVLNWKKKNESDSENITWITAFTKPCPKCQRPIEKNHGCNHMTCNALCGHHFCWLCLGSMLNYSHRCNGYEKKQESSVVNMRTELAKYSHYYERWASNNKSRDIAVGDLSRAREKHIPTLARGQGETVNLLRWVLEAWEQIVECRRVLKWTYVYGFYMDADNVKKKTFFEYLQGEAESALERLHHCAEKEMLKYVEADGRCNDFNDFKSRLITLTGVTRNYFQNLVRAMENNLSDVDSNYKY